MSSSPARIDSVVSDNSARSTRYAGPAALLLWLGLLAGSQSLAGVEIPAPPALWSVVQPIALTGRGSKPISYNGVIFRIQMGTRLGSVYKVGSSKPLNDVRWDKPAGITRGIQRRRQRPPPADGLFRRRPDR